MIVQTQAASLVGVRAAGVTVEATVRPGMTHLEIEGLSPTATRESRVRVRAALHSSGLVWSGWVAIRVDPVELRKRAATLDLAMAIALYATVAPELRTARLHETLLFGELSLGGDLRPGRGLIAQLLYARAHGLTTAVVPHAQLREAALVDGIAAYGARTLIEAIEFLRGGTPLPLAHSFASQSPRTEDLHEIDGLDEAKRALKIAAAGGHHVLLIGPPGCGKTMLARRVAQSMPTPSAEVALEIATIRSAAGFDVDNPMRRAFRAPHHTASATALVGGGDPISPGELTLAHHGILLLDELPEFSRQSLDAVRLAMRAREVSVIRGGARVTMPAGALVIGAMSPCPCGFLGEPTRLCSCTPERIAAYRARVPLGAFDLHVNLGAEQAGAFVSPSEQPRVYRVAQTIARLDGRLRPSATDVAEALHYRLL